MTSQTTTRAAGATASCGPALDVCVWAAVLPFACLLYGAGLSDWVGWCWSCVGENSTMTVCCEHHVYAAVPGSGSVRQYTTNQIILHETAAHNTSLCTCTHLQPDKTPNTSATRSALMMRPRLALQTSAAAASAACAATPGPSAAAAPQPAPAVLPAAVPKPAAALPFAAAQPAAGGLHGRLQAGAGAASVVLAAPRCAPAARPAAAAAQRKQHGGVLGLLVPSRCATLLPPAGTGPAARSEALPTAAAARCGT